MKAVARLVYSYFMSSPVMRAFTLGGLVLICVDFWILATQPQSGDKLWLAFFGMFLFFAGSALMPTMFGRLARSRAIRVLPGGRVKLLASAFVTTLLVSIPAGVLSPAGFISSTTSVPEMMRDPRISAYVVNLAAIVFTSAFLFAGWMYLAMWFFTAERNVVGFFKGLVVIALLIFLPARDIGDLTVQLSWNLVQIAVVWILFGTGFLLWPRFKAARARAPRRSSTNFAGLFSRSAVGREFDTMLGTANPWLSIVGQVLPIVIAARFVREVPTVWLFFLTILSTVTGAIAGEAATRSRTLWLRGDWSRDSLFSAVERSFWRHNSIVLGSLLLFMIVIGGYVGFPRTTLAAGLPLLALGTALSTYLGLMVTRGIRWVEGGLAIVVMSTLMATAMMIAEEQDLRAALGLEVLLAALAFLLRNEARRRWTQIDWMKCRPDRALTVRASR